jgi:hypothetical protein
MLFGIHDSPCRPVTLSPCHLVTLSRFIAIALLVLAPTPVRACNIPVFRYALDNWPSDPYRLTVFHRGPLAADHRDALQMLEKHAAGDTPAIVLELVDLGKNPEAVEGVSIPPEKAELPYLVVRYPAATRINVPIWSGALRTDSLAALVDSPARREYVRRIRGGDAAVWVLLTSGDVAKDDAAEQLLQAEVERLAKELKLPELTGAPEDRLAGEANRPLRLAFSVLRVGRTDPAEEMLVRMLINTEDDLPGRSDPMVFPLFGRGRAMPALIGAGITPGNINDAAAFLAGPCSCEVKRNNPGVDLLLTADWGWAASTEPAPPFRVTPGTRVPIPSPVHAPVAEPSVSPTANAPWSDRAWSLILAGIGIAGLLVVWTGTMVLRSRGASRGRNLPYGPNDE